ncbi:Phospholipase A2, major isoenzyme [Halocaridina rubra]|uniref:Phospholipase A2 n=1 Tax=Halocaridina rubra TaxID=373956 RepID=A0AAN8WR12_HALRR
MKSSELFGVLTVFLGLFVLSECGSSRHLLRQKRYIGQFGDMIRLAVQREALHYNNYGNHCGFQGGELPIVDEVDRCCFNHDRCYDAADAGPCSSSWFGASYVRYDWRWDGQQLHCGASDDPCRRTACECDVTAVECFARHPWNAANKKQSVWDIFA